MQIIQINSEADFYDKFIHDVINNKCGHIGANNVIYRGQYDANWGLLPSVHRGQTYASWDYGRVGISPSSGQNWDTESKVVPNSSYNQACAENKLLERFSISAQESGFSLSEFSFQKRQIGIEKLLSFMVDESCPYPNTEYEDLTCVAQHYGIPTRMLDWTTNYLVSLFFAIGSVKSDFTKFSVFALDTNKILFGRGSSSIFNKDAKQFSQEAYELLMSEIGMLNIIYPPSHLCPNIKAQQGCLSFISHITDHQSNIDYDLVNYIENIDDVLARCMRVVHPQYKSGDTNLRDS